MKPKKEDISAWYVVHTRPKCEHIAASLMAGLEGVETYCPRIRFQKSTRRGKVWFIEALFPSYFFARFVPSQSMRAVNYSQSVIKVVDFGGNLTSVPDSAIAELKREMKDVEVCEVAVGVKVGDTVELTEGPMRGMKGIVNAMLTGVERVRILLEFLGRENAVEVPLSKILTEHKPRAVVAASR
ncbi:transcription termination/antitermination protein NusG [Prosthecobacter sp.]|uniref:transcription termination/antitermination protein NusG n=1 Tax=Prosthecobacter sp. TaxID=1965333 RepID=UPI00378446C7